MNDSEANSSHRFLLARFNVDYITGLRTVGGIEQALLNLSIPAINNTPSERENERRMDDVYNRIIDTIRNLPQAMNRKYAFRALSWIGYATTTLTAQELLVAVCVEAEQYQLNDRNMYTLEGLLDICNGLIVVGEDRQTVRLVHFSARNYLDRSKVIPEDTREAYRAVACSTYLSFDMLKEQNCSSQNLGDLIRDFPFLDYAANNLAFHLSMVKHLLDEGRTDRNCKDSSGRTPLSLVIGGHSKILALLLEKGVEVNFTYNAVSQSDFARI